MLSDLRTIGTVQFINHPPKGGFDGFVDSRAHETIDLHQLLLSRINDSNRHLNNSHGRLAISRDIPTPLRGTHAARASS